MTALQTQPMPERAASRRESWLTALEHELRSRVGWADEAVSPYAINRHRAAARSKSRRATLPSGKAA
jgi:hypothetical protein